MATRSHRELARRQHRTLGHYLAVEAWTRRADCIVVGRTMLESYLDLERFKGKRLKWMRVDLEPWFPVQQAIYLKRAGRPLGSIYLSRVTLNEALMSKTMTTTERVAALNEGGVLTTSLESMPDEQAILGRLVGMASGLVSPS